MNRDHLNAVSAALAAKACLQQLKQTDDHRKEVQAVAFAMTLLAYCRKTRTDVGDVFTVANNILQSKEKNIVGLRALENYMQFEF